MRWTNIMEISNSGNYYYWTPEQDATLKKCYRYDNLDDICKLLEKSKQDLYARARKLKLFRATGAKTKGRYDVRLMRAKDNLIIYENTFDDRHSVKLNLERWNREHESRIGTGEWYISIINYFEHTNDGRF